MNNLLVFELAIYWFIVAKETHLKMGLERDKKRKYSENYKLWTIWEGERRKQEREKMLSNSFQAQIAY